MILFSQVQNEEKNVYKVINLKIKIFTYNYTQAYVNDVNKNISSSNWIKKSINCKTLLPVK